VFKKLIKNSQPFVKKFQKTAGGIFLTHTVESKNVEMFAEWWVKCGMWNLDCNCWVIRKSRLVKPKLHQTDLLWTCCTTCCPQQIRLLEFGLWTCCTQQVVQQVHNKSTTSRHVEMLWICSSVVDNHNVPFNHVCQLRDNLRHHAIVCIQWQTKLYS